MGRASRTRKCALAALAFALFAAAPAASGQSLTLQGRLQNPAGAPILGTAVEFRVQILTPNSNLCALYEETQVRDLSLSGGFFSINLSDGTGTQTPILPTTFTLEQAVSNRLSFSVNSSHCASGTGTIVYSPAADANRRVAIYFRDPSFMGGFEKIPEMDLNPHAYAMEATRLGGFTSASFLRVVDGTTVGNPAPFSTAQFTELQRLIGGTSINYMSSSTGSTTGAQLPVAAGNPASPSAGSIWFDGNTGTVKFSPDGLAVRTIGSSAGGSGSLITSVVAGAGLTGGGSSGAVSLELSPSGVGAGATKGSATLVPQITYDTYGRITGVTEEAITGTVPNAGADGQVLKASGGSWTSASARTADLKSTSDEGSIFPAVTCTAAQTMYWNSGTDKFACQGIALGAPSATVANSYKLVTVAADGRVNGGSSPTSLSGFGITDALSNQNGVTNLAAGNTSGRPSPSMLLAGRLYVDTQALTLYRDNGSTWDIIGSAGASGSLTGVTAGAGLTGGGSSGNVMVSLDTTGVVAVTNAVKVTTDAYGRVTSSGSLAAGDIPSLDWSKITTGKPTDLAGYGIVKNYVENYGSAVSLSAGNTAGRPGTPYVAGRIYIDTQANTVSYDTGSAWQTITSGSGFTGSLGGEVSGAQGSTQVDAINGINRATITSNLNAVTAATDAATNSTLVKRDGTGGFSAKEVRLVDGTTNAVKLKAAGTSADYSLQFPAAAPAPGQSLQSDGSGVLSWVTAAAGSLTNILQGTGINVTGSGATRTVTLADTTVTPNTYGSATQVPQFTVDQQGRITGATPVTISGTAPGGAASGDLGNNYPGPKVVGLQTTPINSTAPGLGQVLKYVSSNWAASTLDLNDLKQNDGTTSAMASASSLDCTASKVMYYDTSTKSLRCQNASIAASTQITGILPLANGGTGVDASSAISQNFVFAGPSGSAGAASFRALTSADLPASASYWTSATGGINYAGGNVGIGTTSPAKQLSIYNSATSGDIHLGSYNATYNAMWLNGDTATTSANFFSGATDKDLYINRPSGRDIHFRENNAASIIFKSGGSVGIGTTAPGSALDVKGTLRLSGSTSGYVGLQPAAAAGSTTYTLPAADGTGGYVLSTNGSGVLSWIANTVGSVTGVTAGTGLTGGTITGTGTIGLGTELTGVNGLSTTGLVKRTGAGAYTAGQASLTADVSGVLPVSNGGTGSASVNANEVFIGPTSGTGVPSFRQLTAADLPPVSGPWDTVTGGINYAGGKVGVDSATPAAKLDVNGEIKLGNTASTCNAANEGQQRYNSTIKNMEFCNGTAWLGFGNTGATATQNLGVATVANLKITNNSSASTTALDISADAIIVSDGTRSLRVDGVSLTNTNTVSGADGRETGLTIAANTWYYLYVIYKESAPANASSLLSASSTAPTMPAGYTFKKRVGAFRTTASALYFPFIQYNSELFYNLYYNVLAAGTATSLTAVNLSGYVPPMAIKAKLTFTCDYASDANNFCAVSINGANTHAHGYAGVKSTGNTFAYREAQEINVPLPTPQRIWYLSGAGLETTLGVRGYTMPD